MACGGGRSDGVGVAPAAATACGGAPATVTACDGSPAAATACVVLRPQRRHVCARPRRRRVWCSGRSDGGAGRELRGLLCGVALHRSCGAPGHTEGLDDCTCGGSDVGAPRRRRSCRWCLLERRKCDDRVCGAGGGDQPRRCLWPRLCLWSWRLFCRGGSSVAGVPPVSGSPVPSLYAGAAAVAAVTLVRRWQWQWLRLPRAPETALPVTTTVELVLAVVTSAAHDNKPELQPDSRAAANSSPVQPPPPPPPPPPPAPPPPPPPQYNHP